MTDHVQGDLLPFASPETVLAHCRQIERRILAISPELTEQECLAMLAELSLASLMLDSIERTVWNRPDYRHRQQLTPVIPIDRVRAAQAGPEPLYRWRRWRKRRRPTVVP